MRIESMNKMIKRLISFLLAAVLVCSCLPALSFGTFAAGQGNVACNVKFSKPAICCDVGDTINLANCGVQFSASAGMTTNGITWTYNGSTVTSFSPSTRGVHTLTATAGGSSKTIYVVAKNPEELEYVLYRNDFDTGPNDYRVVEKSNGGSASVSGGAYILNASSHVDSYVRVLLPSFLDAFGDVKMEASVKVTNVTDAKKWGSLMFRVQKSNYPYYQSCLRYDMSVSNGVELSQRNASYDWEVYKATSFSRWFKDQYNICTVDLKGTTAQLKINGYDLLTYNNVAYANGSLGFQARASKMSIDYVKVTLDGNTPKTTSNDATFAKPAIRADMGDTIDLKSCAVQFYADAIYTSGSNITWKLDGKEITTFTPTRAGVTKLTASNGNSSKNIYVVTRNLNDGEYVLYRNDFDTAPTDFRIVQQTNSTFSHDGAGHYIIDASKSSNAYGRVLLPAFLDDFGNMMLEARYKESNAATERCWSSLMGRAQNGDYPYMQLCIRDNANVSDGVELSQRNEQNKWSVKKTAAYANKTTGNYNTYALVMQNNQMTGKINGNQVLTYKGSPYIVGGMGLQAKGLKITVDYVKVTLGETSAEEDTAVKCTVIRGRPAIGCNAGQKILLDQCNVQFVYGSPIVDGSQVTWKKNGAVITEFTATSVGIHELTATHGHTTMKVYVVAKKSTDSQYLLYYNDFSSGTHDLTVRETSGGGKISVQNGNLVLNASAGNDAYVRAFLPDCVSDIGDAMLVASVKLTNPVDSRKWGSIIFRGQNPDCLYFQSCIRYDPSVSDGVDISQKRTDAGWVTYQKGAFTSWNKDAFNKVSVDVYRENTYVKINDAPAISHTSTLYYSGKWGLQVRGATMTVDYVKLLFTNNNTDFGGYTVSGHYADVRDPKTNLTIAPSLITDVKTLADFDNILNGTPAVAIMTYDVVNGEGRVVFSDGNVSPETALHKLGSKIIPAFRINDNQDADSLASFLIGQDCQDAYAVSSNLAVLKRAYSKWKYIRGVADYSGLTSYDIEDIRYEALANKARVLIMPESTPKATVTKLQDSYATVWLTVGAGKTASVTAINKGPYGIITPNRAVTEECYKSYYSTNTMIRRPVVIGHRGNPSTSLENTIGAAQKAYSLGANAVENDIYLMKDGILMVMHDKTIDRTTNGTGNVVDFTSTQLKKYHVDYPAGLGTAPIPSLEDYFKQVKGKDQRLVVEIKHNVAALAKPLADLIKKYDILDQMVIITFNYNGTAINAIRNELPGIPVGMLGGIEFDNSKPLFMAQEAIELIQGYHTVCNPKYTGLGTASVKALAHRGVTIWPWTLRDQTDFDNMMITGLAGITTDYCQWSSNYVENLTVNSAGRVIATTYAGTAKDVSTSAELVVIEDTLGISYKNGVLTVPQTHNGGSASYFFRYKSTNPSGTTYYTVTDVQTTSAGEHRYTAVVTAPTCNKAGYTTYTCSCGDSYVGEETAPVGHNYKTTIISATCTAEGKRITACTFCGEGTETVIPTTGHKYVWDTCSTCGYVNPNYTPATYYLFGNINGEDYGCEEDFLNMGTYRFINGRLTTSFTEDSYVAVKTEGNGIWYMTNGWQGTELTSVTLYDSNTFDPTQANKLFVPANTYITFIIQENGDGSLTLRYEPALCNHDYICTDRSDPTCDTVGYANYLCSICGEQTRETLSALGHKYIWDTCSVCGYVDPGYTPATYYLFGYINGADYACEGNYTNMGTYRFENGQLKATFSKLSYVGVKTEGNGAWYMTDGWLGADATEAILYNSNTLSNADKLCVPANVHLLLTLEENADGTLTLSYVEDPDSHSYKAKVVAPTCTRMGYTIYTCACGDSYIADRVSSIPHNYQTEVVAPTCDTAGYTRYTCDCGYSYVGDETAQLDHSYEITVIPATCTQSGSTTYSCTSCGDTYSQPLDPTGHRYEKVVTAPTCLVGGHTTYVCVCGDSYTTDGVPALGHRYKVSVLPATCYRDGQRTTTCLNCGEVTLKVITAMPHRYVWGTCSTCGAVEENYTKPNYYLCGYINGMNHGYEEDYANMGEYRFTDGKLTTIFTKDSYVLVKTEGNGIWYMTDGKPEDGATTVTLHDTTTINTSTADRLFVPANTYVTFTMVENADGTLTLSYAPAVCNHAYRCIELTDATCTEDGIATYRCQTCWHSYTETTAAMGHNFDEGICLRCGYEDPTYSTVVQPTITLKYPTLSFEDQILMNVYYSVANTNDVVSMGMIAYETKVTEWNVDNAQTITPGYTWSDADGLYYVTTQGIPAKQLGDTIYFAIYAMLSDGSYTYTNLVSYSPKTYLYNRLKTGEPGIQAMMGAVLNYGAAAQIYFDYKTETLVNADMTEEQRALVADYSDSMIAAVALPDATKLGEMVSNGGYTKRYPTISFEGAFGINYYFKPSAKPVGNVTMYVWNQADYDAVTSLSKSNATRAIPMTLTESGEYLALVDGIAARDLDKGIYVSFCYSDGRTDYCSGVVGYSIGAYCKSQAAKTGTLARLAAATAVYGYYAKQLFS